MKHLLTILSFLFLMRIGYPASAQIICTDINPDFSGNANSPSYSLDLNNDLTVDYQIYLTIGATYSYVSIRASINNSIENRIGGEWNTTIGEYGAFALNVNALIDQSMATWLLGSAQPPILAYVDASKSAGEWLGVSDKYLALKFQFGGNIYYGWARLDVSADASSFTVKEYAYNRVPDQKILAGQCTATGVNQPEDAAISFENHPNPFNHSTTINYSISQKDNVQLMLYDLAGNKAAVLVNEEKPAGAYKIEFNSENISEGMYLLELKVNNKAVVKKLNIIR